MRKSSRRVATGIGAVAAAVGLSIAMAAPSMAQDYIDSGTNIRSGASTGYTAVGLGYPGQGVINGCVVGGGSYSYSNYLYGSGTSASWEHHTDAATGVTGYSGYMLISGTAPSC